VNADRQRILHGQRHNHCYTSPVYRQKVEIINTKLAQRYAKHPALLLWHLSNEYNGECHCDLCQAAFRLWLRRRYQDSLDRLNQAWWNRFWGHAFTDWEQIESPSPRGQTQIHGLNLDWKRFVTDQTVDFLCHELTPLRKLTPNVPATTNLMGTYPGLDYWKLAAPLDVVSWDSYPSWHRPAGAGQPQRLPGDAELASHIAFVCDLNRSLKGGRPFLLMESVPSATNWAEVCKLKRPGMHLLSSLQQVAHGSDSVQYFQWRKSRGGSEKFHGAVVDTTGGPDTRVFRDVASVGEALEKLDGVIGTSVPAEAAIIYDWENNWAIEDAMGLRRQGKGYLPTCLSHYRPLWTRGVAADVINEDCDFTKYRLLIAPMLYMARAGVGERLAEFVRTGGTLVVTYWSGIVDESDLCFLGGFPGPLRKVLGIWSEEIDALYDGELVRVDFAPGNELGLAGPYEASVLCDLIHGEGATVLASYASEFYAGRPAVTVNRFGDGRAYYQAARMDDRFQDDFYARLIAQLELPRALAADLPAGVVASRRTDGRRDFVFLQNWTPKPQKARLPDAKWTDLLAGKAASGEVALAPYGVMVLERMRVG
jgi:beta-galactosidase